MKKGHCLHLGFCTLKALLSVLAVINSYIVVVSGEDI